MLVGGQQKPAIRVQIDPAKLASMGLTLEDVRSVITNATVNSPKGSIDGPDKSYTVLDDDQLTDPAPYNDIVVAWRNGAPVHIGDIGQAVRGPQNRELAALAEWQARRAAARVQAAGRQRDRRRWSASRRRCRRWRRPSRPSVHVSTIVDRTQVIRASVSDVEFTLALSIGLVVMVIFLFLRNVWATIIPSVTVPLALVGTLGAMYLMGFQPRQSVADGPDDRGRLRR